MNKPLLIAFLFITAFVCQVKAGGIKNYDRTIVASCMVLEAGCDGSKGMQAVLNVILNRADGYSCRLVPVIIKRGAFSCMSSVWSTPSPDYSPLIRRAQNQRKAYAAALIILEEMDEGELWDNTYGANHYHANYVTPYWISDMTYITTVGNHLFYTDRANHYATR